MNPLLPILIMLVTAVAVYAIAWVLAWLICRAAALPGRLRPVIAWFLFHLHLVTSLYWVKDLPGAPRAVLKLLLIAFGLSLAFGLILPRIGRKKEDAALCTQLGSWLLAGTLPWVLALLVEAIA
ncbi:MAG: hypothetical protein ACM3XM_01115 [Mycobacterium leprae]